MDDFFVRAMLAGVGVALAAGPLGCFLVWRRMAFFGGTLSHSALLGVALGFMLGINLSIGVLIVGLVVAALLVLLERQRVLPSDTLLAILAHSALAVGLVTVAFMAGLRIDLLGYLFGDVLAVSAEDLYLIYGLTIVATGTLALIWRPLLSATVNEELASVEGMRVTRDRLVLILLIAGIIAVGMKIVGILLIVSLLIIPAAAARRPSRSPEQMAVLAAVIGVGSVVLGLFGSMRWDVPAGPGIVVVTAMIFVVIMIWPRWRTS